MNEKTPIELKLEPNLYVSWAQERRECIEALLAERLNCSAIYADAQVLHEAMAYSVLGGGKRFRALLVYATAKCLGVPLDWVDESAVALELIHAYSLIHDDLPAMDNDVMRRGKPTCHVQFGEAMAILAGDALQALAFECLVNAPISDQAKLAQVSILAVAAGRSGMVGGQVLDMQFTGRGTELDLDSLMATHRAKTGALIEAAVCLPLPISSETTSDIASESTSEISSQARPEMNEILVCIGKRVGLLFQMVDDVLDITVSASELGKTQGKDAAQNKLTYPAVMGLAKTQTAIQGEWQAVLTDLMQLIDMGCDAQSVNLMACLVSETLGLKTDKSL